MFKGQKSHKMPSQLSMILVALQLKQLIKDSYIKIRFDFYVREDMLWTFLIETNDPQINTITCGPQVHQNAETHSQLECQSPFSILIVLNSGN